MSKCVYIFPDRFYRRTIQDNPYLSDLADAFEEQGYNVIRSKTGALGVLDIFIYLFKVDIVAANWIEESINTKFGYLKYFSLYLLLPLLKLFNIKLVWTIHNKRPHGNQNIRIVHSSRSLLFRFSNLIIAHTSFGLQDFGKYEKKIQYFPHPFRKILDKAEIDQIPEVKKYDILIWGRIESYKGILEFLQYLKNQNREKDFSVFIQGKCTDESYWQKLLAFESSNIQLRNDFLSDEDLDDLLKNSKIILFTHQSESVLSSGAVIESLRYCNRVVGPANGNFMDLHQQKIIRVYNDFDDLLHIIWEIKENRDNDFSKTRIYDFIKNHTWLRFVDYILKKCKL